MHAAVPAAVDDATGRPALRSSPLTINGRAVTIVASTADAATTRAMIDAVGRNAVPPAQTGKRGGLSAACALAGDASDPLVARMELRCNGWRVEFVRLCPNGQCRYDLISRQFLPERPIAPERPGPLKPGPLKPSPSK
jgi:hypothetical protein